MSFGERGRKMEETQNYYYSRKLATFPSVEAVVLQFVVSLSLYNYEERKSLEEITYAFNQKLKTNSQFKTILRRVIPNVEELSNEEMESILSNFLESNEEIVLGLKNGMYYVKEYGKNYERIEK